MIKTIVKDEKFLQIPSEEATIEDISVAQDLLDTVTAHQDGCVGMAANMIGISKNIIIFDNEGEYMLMFNPKIVRQKEPYSTEEGCLSLEGKRHTKRYNNIKVEYKNEAFQQKFKSFTGWTAQIIQHEIDHCNGILI